MYVAVVPNRKSAPAILLRESYREGSKVRTRTLANLSSLNSSQLEGIRKALRDEPLVNANEAFEKLSDRSHGAVDAVRITMRRLGLDRLLNRRSCRERDLIVGLIAARIIEPHSKLATTRWWETTTLAEDLQLQGATEDDVYEAMDWLLERQDDIEARLAQRHLHSGGLVLYDLSSSYFEGTKCPLASFGHNRDGKKGKQQVNYGLLTDERGCPISVSVFEGNVADPTTLLPQVHKVRQRFGLEEMVLVGDRGMLSQKQIDALSDSTALSWITALKTGQIRKLVHSESLQLGLFDERNLFEFEHPDFPKERLIACKNPELAEHRAKKRQSLLEATEAELLKIQEMVRQGRLRGAGQIGVRVGKVVNKYKVQKHFELDVRLGHFTFSRREEQIAEEASLDGVYVVRTSVTQKRLSEEDTVRSYKKLANVERAFRSMKTVDLKIRPIYHRHEDRVRAHIFLCMLAYYVEWHMREAWRPLLFCDEDQDAKAKRDPVAPAQRSASALKKIASKRLDDGTPVHSFATLLADLATITRSVCRPCGGKKATAKAETTFVMTTSATPTQGRALKLLKNINL